MIRKLLLVSLAIIICSFSLNNNDIISVSNDNLPQKPIETAYLAYIPSPETNVENNYQIINTKFNIWLSTVSHIEGKYLTILQHPDHRQTILSYDLYQRTVLEYSLSDSICSPDVVLNYTLSDDEYVYFIGTSSEKRTRNTIIIFLDKRTEDVRRLDMEGISISVNSSLARNDKELFFIGIQQGEDIKTTEWSLFAISLETNAIREVLKLEQNASSTIVSTSEGGVIIQTITIPEQYRTKSRDEQFYNRVFHIMKCDDAGNCDDIFSFKSHTLQGIFSKSLFYYIPFGETTLYSFDMDTKEKRQLTDLSFLSDLPEWWMDNESWDNRILIHGINTMGNELLFSINPETGANSLLTFETRAPQIIFEQDSCFLVKDGVVQYSELFVGDDGEEWVAEREEPNLCTISCSDFWEGKNSFDGFEDSVHISSRM